MTGLWRTACLCDAGLMRSNPHGHTPETFCDT